MLELVTSNAGTTSPLPEAARQKLFFSGVMGRGEISKSKNISSAVYRDLVFHRYREAITAMFPIFTSAAGRRLSEHWIREFMRAAGGTSPVIWKMTEEFKDFLLSRDDFAGIPWAFDLLWYEWTQAALFMKDYHPQKPEPFDLNRKLSPGPSAVKKEISYAPHLKFSSKIKDTVLLLYYDFDKYIVYYRELTPFASRLLDLLAKRTPEEAILLLCGEYAIEGDKIDETRKICRRLLHELYEKRIIVTLD